MKAKEQDLDSLQEKASELYLQGEFRQALVVWRQLLEHAPDHERAQEGVRLCEVLAEQMEAAEAANVDQPAQAAPAPAPTPAEDDALEIDLSALNLDASSEPAPAQEPPPVPEPPAADPLNRDLHAPDCRAEGLDLGEIDETETIALSDPPAPTEEPAAAGNAAASELRQRVGELLTEAQEAYRSGDHEQALSLVSRVFILDEENEIARDLHERLVSTPEAESSAGPDEDLLGHLAEPATAEVPSLDLEEIEDAGTPKAVPLAPQPAEPAAEEAPVEAEELGGFEDAAALGGDPFSGEDAVVDPLEEEIPPPAAPARKVALPIKPLVFGAGVIVLAAAGFFGWKQLSGESSETEAPAPTAAASAPAPAGQPPSGPAATPAAPAAAASTEDFATVLERARAAFESGDYAKAIVAYNEVARRDPGNIEAQDQLAVAGERYRVRKEILDQWARAIELFNQGDYRSSMVLLYRLPKNEDPERVARYTRNGWYNMGLQSLQAGDCKKARDNFREARSIDSEDRGVRQGLALCQSCLAGEKSSSFYRTVNQLPYRGLDD